MTQKIRILSGLITAPLLIALAIWLGLVFWKAESAAKFMSAFQALQDGKARMSVAEVQNLLGAPVRIDQSESADQTINGSVYHYPTYPAGGDFKVVFINGVLFRTELLPYKPS
jgi:hypothetical protein